MNGPVRLGTFLVTEPVGTGGMGTVWRARHPEGVDVAVKVLRPDYGGSLLDAFRAEVRSVASLDHPHVVRVYDYGVVPEATAEASGGELPRGSPWLAMEFGDKGTLGDLTTLGTFEELARVIEELLEGLAHAHARGLVHRDLKPRNVLLFDGPGPPRTALTDFGIAHLFGKVDANTAQAGTPGYMAPEQIKGDRRALGSWTDLYSLGCVTYRMATGRTPFAGPSKYHVLKAHLSAELPRLKAAFPVPDGFEDYWRRLMAREVHERFQTAAEAIAALRTVTGRPPPATDWRPTYPATRERPRGTGLGIFLLRPWPLTGREPQQDRLWNLLRRQREPGATPARVLIDGGRGMGKTRMAQWLSQRAEETGMAEAWRFPAGVPLRKRLRSALRVEGLSEEDAALRLERWLSRRGSPNPAKEAVELARELGSTEDAWAFAPFFQRLVHDRPALFVFDDLHRADPGVLRWFVDLPAAGVPILAVATVGDDAPEPLPLRELRAGTTLTKLSLPPLTPDEHRRLVAFVGLSPRLAENVLQRTSGSPWFTIRMVTDWARAGGLVPTTTGYDLRPGFDPQLPDDVYQYGLERLAAIRSRLPGADQALELLALQGAAPVREEEWRAICLRVGALWHPARLQSMGLVAAAKTGRTTRYTFVEPWLRDVLLQAATAGGRRRALHLASAECLLQIHRVGARERAIEHLASAGERDRAIEGLRSMVDEAFHHDRLDRVEAFLDRERELLAQEGVDEEDARRVLHELDALRLSWARTGPGAPGTVLDRAARTSSAPIRARSTLLELQLVAAGAADPRWAEARKWFEEARDPRGWRRALGWRARLRGTKGDVAGALADAREAKREAETQGDEPDRARFEALELALLILHRHFEAPKALAEARRRALEAGQPERAAAWLAWTSACLRARADLDGAAAAAEGAKAELHALGASTALPELQRAFVSLARKAWGDAGAGFGRVLADRDAPADVAQLARAGLLVTTAEAEQWDLWDDTLAALTARLPPSDDPGGFPTLDPDVAAVLDQGAITALQRGEVARARDLLRVALRHHLARRDPAAAARTRERLAGISS